MSYKVGETWYYECGKDFCGECGDCLDCYSDGPCCGRSGVVHYCEDSDCEDPSHGRDD